MAEPRDLEQVDGRTRRRPRSRRRCASRHRRRARPRPGRRARGRPAAAPLTTFLAGFALARGAEPRARGRRRGTTRRGGNRDDRRGAELAGRSYARVAYPAGSLRRPPSRWRWEMPTGCGSCGTSARSSISPLPTRARWTDGRWRAPPWTVGEPVRIGSAPGPALSRGRARAITTGGAVPPGTTAVVRQEHALLVPGTSRIDHARRRTYDAPARRRHPPTRRGAHRGTPARRGRPPRAPGADRLRRSSGCSTPSTSPHRVRSS